MLHSDHVVVTHQAGAFKMVNLNDGSWQIQPELSYTGLANWELRVRLIVFGGQPNAEFTTKTASARLEVYGRYFF